jgi:spore photoproduct lyase
MSDATYADKLRRLEADTLLPRLGGENQEAVRGVALSHRFTFQELRRVAEAARDLEMWREEPLGVWWGRAEEEVGGSGRERKKALLSRLEQHMGRLARAAKSYPMEGLAAPPRRNVRLQRRESDAEVFGLCAAYSEKTVCCGLRTLDAVRGCSFGCSYCTIQTFYGEVAELENGLAEKLDAIELDPDHLYHIGTGQASDSLIWGNRDGVLDALLGFARRHTNVVLELKTKSDNVRPLLERSDLPANLVCSWSLNPETVIRNEEHGTASLERRLAAARRMVDHGSRVGFHFHPMVFYDGWREEYAEVVARLLESFTPSEVLFVSMGAVTFIKPVVREIRRRGGETKILQMDLVPDHHGKLTYPDETKVELFGRLFSCFGPWREEVFFYLCMEAAPIWQRVLGTAYPTNAEFERAFASHCLARLPVSGGAAGHTPVRAGQRVSYPEG